VTPFVLLASECTSVGKTVGEGKRIQFSVGGTGNTSATAKKSRYPACPGPQTRSGLCPPLPEWSAFAGTGTRSRFVIQLAFDGAPLLLPSADVPILAWSNLIGQFDVQRRGG